MLDLDNIAIPYFWGIEKSKEIADICEPIIKKIGEKIIPSYYNSKKIKISK